MKIVQSTMRSTFHTSRVSVFMACELSRLGYESSYFEMLGEPYVTFSLALGTS